MRLIPNNRGRWLTLGAAWKKTLDDGQIGYSVKLNTVPVGSGWDGTLMLLPPLPKSDEADHRSESGAAAMRLPHFERTIGS